MKQITAKTVEQALIWIDSQPHNLVGIYWNKKSSEGTYEYGEEDGMQFVNYHEKLRVPNKIRAAVARKIEQNPRPFDTRMFRVTKYGKAWLKAQMHKAAVSEGLTIFEQMVRDGELKLHGSPDLRVV